MQRDLARGWRAMAMATATVCLFVGCQLANQASPPPAKSQTASIPIAPMPHAAAPSKTPPRNLKAKIAASQAAASQAAASQATAHQPASSPPTGVPAARAQSEAPQDSDAPQTRTTFYRLDKMPAKIPPVSMTKDDEAMCRVKVGDTMPAISLPKLGGGGEASLTELSGKNATVVVFWKTDRRMTTQLLADLVPDVLKPFGNEGVAVVGIAVNEKEADAKAALEKYGARTPQRAYTNLLDADGKAFAELGSGKLPRIYVLDSSGKIVWFDIEYSMATRRELHQVLRSFTDGK